MTEKMEQQNTSRVLLDTWMDHLGRVIAWAGLVFWITFAIAGFATLFGETSHENSADYYMPYVCVGLAALNGWALVSIGRRRALLSDFRRYCAVFAREPDKSIPDLAAALGIPAEKVMLSLEKMCRRGYFNGYIDHRTKRMVFTHYSYPKDAEKPDLNVIQCPGCGALNVIEKTGDACRYCGTPLELQQENPT